ncbi:MAG: cyclic nucleotide-binding domain-containing protein [Planctomycetes bacterium]|nr:cyclic nucleotide-binding domain-containing protein [Planctomycetota bacterium]
MSQEPTKVSAVRQQQLQRKTIAYPAGSTVFKEGDTSSDVYLLAQGAVQVVKAGAVIAEIDEPMSYFGEMAALLGEPRTATILAKTDCQFIKVPGDKLDSVIDLSPVIGKKIMRALSQRLLDANRGRAELEAQAQGARQELSDFTVRSAKEYKRLVWVIALYFKVLKLPQLRELFEFAKASSALSAFACKADLEAHHFTRFPSIAKMVEQENSRGAP